MDGQHCVVTRVEEDEDAGSGAGGGRKRLVCEGRDHYSVHSLYEMSAAIVSYQVLSDRLLSRPLVLSRSDATGIGQWAALVQDGKELETSEEFSSVMPRLVTAAIR
eukprot:764722-Hanusia_phi.AAC.2